MFSFSFFLFSSVSCICLEIIISWEIEFCAHSIHPSTSTKRWITRIFKMSASEIASGLPRLSVHSTLATLLNHLCNSSKVKTTVFLTLFSCSLDEIWMTKSKFKMIFRYLRYNCAFDFHNWRSIRYVCNFYRSKIYAFQSLKRSMTFKIFYLCS